MEHTCSGHASFIRNAAFAVTERIAFAWHLEGPQAQAVTYQDSVADADDPSHSDLSEAREKVNAFAWQRIRELQLLTRWPLVQPARTPGQLKLIQQSLEQTNPWDILGEQGSAVLDLPSLPGLVRKDLLGPVEFLLALSGQMGKDGPPAPPGLLSVRQESGLVMPWMLRLVTFLPALRSLHSPTLESLRAFFCDLRPQQRHVGIDDRQQPWFKDMKLHSGRAVLRDSCAPTCRSFLRFGAPPGLRPQLWEAALCLPPLRTQDLKEFAELCGAVLSQQALLDVSVCADVQSIADSAQFFLFEEMLRAVLLAFSRDPLVRNRAAVEQLPDVAKMAASAMSAGRISDAQQLLASGSMPVCGLTLLAAPLCYLYEHPASVYRVFRSMYSRYWCKLHALVPLAGHSPALPVLVKTYEQLLQELDPEVVAHMHALSLPISALALPWIYNAFAGHLVIEEVLLLWDRIIGLDSLLPLPLLAVAIMCFRRQVILTCQSCNEVVEVMSDITQLQTMPLLQAVLFQG